MPAFLAALIPEKASSITAHSSGFRFNFFAAKRKISGSGFDL